MPLDKTQSLVDDARGAADLDADRHLVAGFDHDLGLREDQHRAHAPKVPAGV